MSSMKATGGHSAACCNIPPVVPDNYQKKGDYHTIGDRKTYVTGPVDSASKGILVQVAPCAPCAPDTALHQSSMHVFLPY